MKSKNILIIVFFCSVFCLSGCYTNPDLIPHSFAENESNTAKVIFVRQGSGLACWANGVRLIDYEGIEMPVAEKKMKYWQEVTLPAGKPMNLRVYIYLAYDRSGERRRGIFKCPPLEAGRTYKVWNSGNYLLLLTDASVKRIRKSMIDAGRNEKSKYKIIYKQQIPPTL